MIIRDDQWNLLAENFSRLGQKVPLGIEFVFGCHCTVECEVRGIDRSGRLQARVISISTNLEGLPLSLDFNRRILFPDVQLSVNGRTMKLDPSREIGRAHV